MIEPVFVGIDPSIVNTGIGILNNGEITTYSISTPRKPKGIKWSSQQLWDMQMWIFDKVCAHIKKDTVCVIEDFGSAALYSPSTYEVERLELAGMIKLAVELRTKHTCLRVKPSHVRALATGKASGHKDQVLDLIRDRFGVPARNNDESDAATLALAGYLVYHYEKPEGDFWINQTDGHIIQFDKAQLRAVKKIVEDNPRSVRRKMLDIAV